jgi:hypothetical protein
MLGGGGAGRVNTGGWALILVAGALAVLPWPNPHAVERFLRPAPAVAALTAIAATYVMLEVGRGAATSFIYFQF